MAHTYNPGTALGRPTDLYKFGFRSVRVTKRHSASNKTKRFPNQTAYDPERSTLNKHGQGRKTVNSLTMLALSSDA